MKIPISALMGLAILSALMVSCDFGTKPNEDLVNQTGTVKEVNPGVSIYLIVPDYNPNEKLFADNLPLAFQKDGTKILCSGYFLPTDPASLYIAIPFRLTKTKKLD
jgi:hypothetical protein